MPTHAHVGWGLLISLTLHVSGVAALSLALPRLNVRPGVVRQVEFAVLEAPAETAAPPLPAASADFAVANDVATAAPPPAGAAHETEPATTALDADGASIETSTAARPLPPRAAAPMRKPVAKQLTAAASPRQISSATHADPRSDGSALQRVLTQIASTTQLTPDERRKAMLVVLRTWEDPSGKHSAEELIDALLKDARKTRAEPQQK